jgi:hypothetical protein
MKLLGIATLLVSCILFSMSLWASARHLVLYYRRLSAKLRAALLLLCLVSFCALAFLILCMIKMRMIESLFL